MSRQSLWRFESTFDAASDDIADAVDLPVAPDEHSNPAMGDKTVRLFATTDAAVTAGAVRGALYLVDGSNNVYGVLPFTAKTTFDSGESGTDTRRVGAADNAGRHVAPVTFVETGTSKADLMGVSSAGLRWVIGINGLGTGPSDVTVYGQVSAAI